MSRVHRVGVIAGPRSGEAKTYADFVAHISSLTAATRTWETNASISSGAFRTTANNTSLSSAGMNGSSWQTLYGNGAAPARILQHALPDQAAWQAQRDLSRQIYFVIATDGTGDVTALNRNGYLSFSGTGVARRRITRVLLWIGSDAEGAAFEIDPSTGTGPTPYVIP